MDRIGRAGRAIARKRALQAILKGRTPAQLAALDALLAFDPAIRQTRFGWLGAWSDSPGAANLNGLLDRLDFLRGLAMDPACRETVHPDRWKQIVREGDAAPAWLAEDFGADRRRATLLAYLTDLRERLTDEAIHMFCKQIGRLFARAAAACEERHKSSRKRQSIRRLYGWWVDRLAVDQSVQHVQDMRLGWRAGLQCEFDGSEHGLLVVLEDESQNLDHLAVAAGRLEHALLQSSEGGRAGVRRTARRCGVRPVCVE
jgi:hypothetical protein